MQNTTQATFCNTIYFMSFLEKNTVLHKYLSTLISENFRTWNTILAKSAWKQGEKRGKLKKNIWSSYRLTTLKIPSQKTKQKKMSFSSESLINVDGDNKRGKKNSTFTHLTMNPQGRLIRSSGVGDPWNPTS